MGRTGADGDDLAVAAAARARALSACPLARARDALAPSAAPRRLPCREAERAAVESFVESVLDAGVREVSVPGGQGAGGG